jgi:hypothetical protein
MTTLDADNIRKLDALNLIEAFVKDDAEARRQMSAVYARASLKDDGLSSFELAHCCAQFASLLFGFAENGDELLALCRARLFSDGAP